MSKEAWEIIGIIGSGMLGISFVMFIKMQEICDANDKLNMGQVVGLFFKKCWASYGASLTAVIFYSITHNNWVSLLTDSKNPTSTTSKVMTMTILMGALVGALVQYGAYRILLKRLDGLLKNWGTDKNGKTTDKPHMPVSSSYSKVPTNKKPAPPRKQIPKWVWMKRSQQRKQNNP